MRSATLIRGDVLERLPELEEASFDACLCDPPYGLSSDSPERVAYRLRGVLSKVMFPDLDQVEPFLAEQIDLAGIALDGSRLSRVKVRRIVEARVGVPKRSVK